MAKCGTGKGKTSTTSTAAAAGGGGGAGGGDARYKAILLFGGPGTGKGTQGKVLGAILGFQHCSTGDIFRGLDKQSELGRLFLSYSTKGLLVPDDVTVRIWADAMRKRVAAGTFKPDRNILVLDGIPRTVEQAKIMEKHVQVLKVIHLVAADQKAMVQRMKKRALKENRMDDADEKVIQKRWSVYDAETKPVLAQYASKQIAEINAIASPAQVLLDILKVVAPLHEKAFGQVDL